MPTHRLPKRIISACTATAACALVLPISSSYAEEALPVASAAEASSDDYGASSIDVNSAVREEGTDLVTVTWTINVKDSDDIYAGDLTGETFEYTGEGSHGVTALDEENQLRFYTLRDERGICLCAGVQTPGDFIDPVREDSSAPYWNTFMIPQDTKKITLEFPGFEPAQDVPIE
ncbi:hypothetical protein O4J56_10900 [Nocardiopsis sp. RSe5-2]|uniref:Uncharacterized protein n=1 Tax=Nocardiopsis endophytica TaxID=3018445 RepID=A0ABT4U3X5_9ACTN|nr:hypothetical protein [Nocardiopsis endophytica]MDA2811145.1 hypothetical protein [Nocardiopsis endophytica]